MYVILSCFAGRKQYMSILFQYVDSLLKKQLIHKFDIWDYSRTEEDYMFINDHKHKTGYEIKNVQNKNIWDEYYQYYANANLNDSIVIKCDDDIVYIDISQFQQYIDFVNDNKQYKLVFPSIVNNGICAYYQQQNGLMLLKPTDLIFSHHCESVLYSKEKWEYIHNSFIDDIDSWTQKTKDILPIAHETGVRFSINFFAIHSDNLELFGSLPRDSANDEYELTVAKESICSIFMPFTVSHFTFIGQRNQGINEKQMLDRYSSLTKKDVITYYLPIPRMKKWSDSNISGSELAAILTIKTLHKMNKHNFYKLYIPNIEYAIHDGIEYTNNIDDLIDSKILIVSCQLDLPHNIDLYKKLEKVFIVTHTFKVVDPLRLNMLANRGIKIELVAQSNWTLDFIKHNNSLNYVSNYHIIPNGIDINTGDLVLSNSYKKNPLSFVFLACFERGGQIAINVFKRIKQQYPDAEFHIADYNNINHHTSDGIFFHGSLHKKELYELLIKSTYFIYPLALPNGHVHKDTFACCVAEAIAMGVRVITFKCATLPDVYGDCIDFCDIYNPIENESKLMDYNFYTYINDILSEQQLDIFVDKVKHCIENPLTDMELNRRRKVIIDMIKKVDNWTNIIP